MFDNKLLFEFPELRIERKRSFRFEISKFLASIKHDLTFEINVITCLRIYLLSVKRKFISASRRVESYAWGVSFSQKCRDQRLREYLAAPTRTYREGKSIRRPNVSKVSINKNHQREKGRKRRRGRSRSHGEQMILFLSHVERRIIAWRGKTAPRDCRSAYEDET